MGKKPKSLADANSYKSAGRWWNALSASQRHYVLANYGWDEVPGLLIIQIELKQ
ncbi:MAG: hypothetical protein ACYDEQ_05990 [Desulfocucumaceae bacterium]